ncbi:glycosyl hydrolases family 31-domain-containing protein [Paraphysoderma sedebokerense]|nr:glycosyl hydrolases family 31-domain-containing protein [Paraphysoderma sedebokerense]
MQGGKIGRVWIGDVEEKRWQVPGVVSYPIPSTRSPPATPEFTFHYHRKPFEFWIERATDKTIIFDTRGYEFVFEYQYIEITTSIPDNANIFGLGEVIHALRRDPHATRQAMWTLDTATPVDSNLYGAHPFYLEMRNRSAHGVLLLNSNGMDVVMQNNRITYKIIGGVLDFWFMMGPTPIEVIQQYTELIGRPPLPSYWSFGFHQCRYGYESLDQVKNVVKGFKDANIPLESTWIDIDYMEIFKDFTFSPFFPAEHMKEFAEQLHNDSQRMVLIVDPAIKIESGYKVYETGLRDDVFVKNKNGDVLVGRVVCISLSLPGPTAYPDFFNPATKNWWKQSIKDFLDQVPVDGLWIDMNEPSNFCNGECEDDFVFGTTNKNSVDPSSDKLNNPPYKIDNGGIRAPLTTKTYSMDARHFNGTLAYDVHNLYGFSESKVTYQALKELGFDRPFVLSRSTFVGSGKYAGHWGGDNWSNWEHLYYSIPTVLSFQMFGIPYVGVDICGFIGDASEELCARWMAMGAFFPFSRNHNSIGYQPQEPYLWDTVAEASRQTLKIRYSLLPYFYTLFWINSMTGIPPLRPLWMEWTDDEKLLYFDRQFLIGGALLISPVLTPNTERMDVYLPKAKWYDYRTHTPLQAIDSYITIKTPLTYIPIHVRGGNVIPSQYPGYTTTECRRNNWTVLVALDEEGTAKGELYIDDGNGDPESIRTTKAFQLVSFTAGSQRFKVDILENGYEVKTWIDEIVILGVYSTFTKVTLVTDSREFVLRSQEWYYDERKSKLVLWVSRQRLNWNKSWEVNWK